MEAVVSFLSSSWVPLASGAISAVGALSSGRQQQQASEYNAAIARRNAVAARQQAAANAEAQQRKARMQIGSMRAAYGASGVGLEGSPLDVLESSAMMAELDRQNILYSGELSAIGDESNAGLELMRGENAVTGSYFGAASSLLSGAAEYGVLKGKNKEVSPKRTG